MFLLDAAEEKPILDIDLTGPDGTIFVLAGLVAQAWREQGREDIARELRQRLPLCHSYDGPDGSLALVKSYYTQGEEN